MAEINQIDFGDGVTRDLSDATSRVLLPATVGWTGKNKLNNILASNYIDGVTFTVDPTTKTITVNGQTTAASNYSAISFVNPLSFFGVEEGKKYRLVGAPAGASHSTYRHMFITFNSTDGSGVATGTFIDLGNGVEFTVPVGTKSMRYRIDGINTGGQSVVFYPMLLDPAISDLTYEPYHKSVEECLEEKVGWDDVSGDVQKNLLNFTASGKTENNVTFTVNADKSVKVTTGSGGASANTNLTVTTTIKKGSYIITGCPANGSATTYEASLAYKPDGGSWSYISERGSGLSRIFDADVQFSYTISIKSGYSAPAGGIVFQPMIRLASIEDPAYAPYVPSNSELANRIKKVTFTATTSGGGNANVPDLDADNGQIILSAYTYAQHSGNSILCIPFSKSNGTWGISCLDSYDRSAVSNSEIEFVAIYIQL